MPPDGPESARERGHPESVSERAAVGQRAGGLYPPGGGGRSAGEEWGRGGREELVGVPRARAQHWAALLEDLLSGLQALCWLLVLVPCK